MVDGCSWLRGGRGYSISRRKGGEVGVSDSNPIHDFFLLTKMHLYHDRIPSAASLTVEASLVLPIFLFAVLTICYMGLLAKTQDEVRHAMTRIVSEASAEAGALRGTTDDDSGETGSTDPDKNPAKVGSDNPVSRVFELSDGGERGGGEGLLGGLSDLLLSPLYYRGKLELYMGGTSLTTNLLGSSFLENNDEIDMIVTYTADIPFPLLGFYHPLFRERVHSRAFVGVDTRVGKDEEEDVIVYVTPTGRVYHRNKNCTYLKLSVSQVLYGDIAGMRNEGGGKYYPCSRCAGGVMDPDAKVYITNFGDRFHVSRACSEIKRTIEEIHLSQVGSRSPCSKCGMEE